MLHEILLSLSGVSSPALTRAHGADAGHQPGIQQYVSAPERAMLDELAQLSLLHFEVRKAATSTQNHHPAPICRAVSSSILDKQLGAFRHKIVEVESSILRKDAAYVGGYDIVPLSTIVTDFAPWSRRLEWLRKATSFMSHDEMSVGSPRCSGAALLDFLEKERHTGYADVEMIASDLLQVAEICWMRMVSPWVLYGKLPEFGQDDFMVKQPTAYDSTQQYTLNIQLTPYFVNRPCAESILGIGNALNQIRRRKPAPMVESSSDLSMTLLPDQVRLLKNLTLPLSTQKLEAVMNEMNILVSESALSQLLPLSKILEVCTMLQDYLLLSRGEFAIALINNVEERLSVRGKGHEITTAVRKLGKLDHLSLKEAELSAILAKTWSDLSVLQSELETEDEAFASARRLLKLTALEESDKPDEDVLISTLVPSTALLRVDIPIDSPMNIFISHGEVAKYSHINSHLLSLRRCQIRLANLWKLTSHRRCHPSPLAPPVSATEYGRRNMKHRRQRDNTRSSLTRRHWSSMSKALFVINELAAYLQGEVIKNSWTHFHKWLTKGHYPPQASIGPDSATNPPSIKSSANTRSPYTNVKQSTTSRRDARTIAQAHQKYLASLYSALFIDKPDFNKSLNALLILVDHFTALFTRLQTAWQGLDLQEDDGIVDAFMNYAQDEKDVLAEMHRSGSELETVLRDLVQRIKDIEQDRQRGDDDVAVGVASVGLSTDADGRFMPWRARTLDRLIMKLDFWKENNDKSAQGNFSDADDDDGDEADALQ